MTYPQVLTPEEKLAPTVAEEPEFAGTRQCGHDDYHDTHEWADRPHIWCPGHSFSDAAEEPCR